jgi:peptide-methionine (S)-S-oxide reductase
MSRPLHLPLSRGRSRLLQGLGAAALVLTLAGLAWHGSVTAGEQATLLPAPLLDAPTRAGDGLQKAVLAGGCFWGIQAVYQHAKGVRQVISGYSGGDKPAPSYEEVSAGTTGHAEAVQITFDPREISYGKILQIYFSVAHDPTQLNRQGPDVGTQYRSAIFYADDTQERVADAYIAQLDGAKAFKRTIVTKVAPLTQFFSAEAYHQDYALNHPNQPYIVFNDLPKVDNFKRLFAEIYRDAPVTVAPAGKGS